MSQRYNGNTKKPKPKENLLKILKIYAFCLKIQQRASVQEKVLMGYISIFKNIPKKLLHLSLKVATTLCSGSRKVSDGA